MASCTNHDDQNVQQMADIEDVGDRDDVYIAPEGDRGWTTIEVGDEEYLRRTVAGQEVEEAQLVLLPREYLAIGRARRELEDSKSRFVDDPPGALRTAREAVGRALEAEDILRRTVRMKRLGPAKRSYESTRKRIRDTRRSSKTRGVPSTGYRTG